MPNKKIAINGVIIRVASTTNEDYISLTDIARYKDQTRTDYIIQNWLRNRNTIEFLGIWEKLDNTDSNPIEFDGIRNKSGLNSLVLTPNKRRDENPNEKGNIRDHANVSQLVCLSNLESLNAVFINEGYQQAERLEKLNQIAIQQISILVEDRRIKGLENGNA